MPSTGRMTRPDGRLSGRDQWPVGLIVRRRLDSGLSLVEAVLTPHLSRAADFD